MIVNCPKCGNESETEGNPFRPFCCERCKLIDLDNWMSENYRIPGENDAKEVATETTDAENTI